MVGQELHGSPPPVATGRYRECVKTRLSYAEGVHEFQPRVSYPGVESINNMLNSEGVRDWHGIRQHLPCLEPVVIANPRVGNPGLKFVNAFGVRDRVFRQPLPLAVPERVYAHGLPLPRRRF